MFEGVPDQFHQFIASRTSSLPLPVSFPPLHGSSTSSNTSFSSFYHPYTTATTITNSHHNQQVPLQHPNFLHSLHHSSDPTGKNHEDKEEDSMVAMNLEIERERSIQESVDPWSNDEVLALLRIRSSMENWFPEYTWEHVSRKLAELGFKRSAEKCKEKFEEENRYFNNINYSKNNYRFFGELEELYNGHNNQNPQEAVAAEKNKKMDKASQKEEDKIEQNVEEDSRVDQTVGNYPTEEDNNGKEVEKSKSKKRKRQIKFEMFKGFCEDIISKIMAQQEEMHNKLLEDMVKRDEEKVAREEAWKKQEIDRINKELELRAQEQVLAGERQTAIINFLKKFSSSSSSSSCSSIEILQHSSAHDLLKVPNSSNPSSSSSLVIAHNPNPTSQTNNQSKPEAPTSTRIALGHQDSSPAQAKSKPAKLTSLQEKQAPQIPSSSSFSIATTQNPKLLNSQSNPLAPSSLSNDILYKKPTTSNNKDDLGKRWPKDEVLALINLRCSLCSSNEDKEATTVKAPLWERISQGMLELGYKRSAKRCKEKWENINKYFRKTKDVNKKRSVDSRTCPYFHQLSTLYNQGTLAAPPLEAGKERPQSALPENHTASKLNSSLNNGSSNSTLLGNEGEKNLAQASGFDFEF
ncbi:trihelix transcription factor GTL2 [Ricinus communis]|uniref:trihelix transcription factor GTL2 n=1 Tax=Ricinus communis TaxID=3988 RepID=UPI00201AB3FF|nr:trihelix transcription factor GTL2 [Ricinus communis]